MAFTDYQYIGYTDEKIVATLILKNLSKVIKARKDRQAWLESLAMDIAAQTDTERVSGGQQISKSERYVEQLEADKVMRWLLKIELRLTTKIKSMSKRERDILQDFYILGHLTERDIANKYGIGIRTVRNIKLESLKKIIPTCVSVYKEFCFWRAYDDVDLVNRKKDNDNEIIRRLRKKKEAGV